MEKKIRSSVSEFIERVRAMESFWNLLPSNEEKDIWHCYMTSEMRSYALSIGFDMSHLSQGFYIEKTRPNNLPCIIIESLSRDKTYPVSLAMLHPDAVEVFGQSKTIIFYGCKKEIIPRT